MNHHSHRVTRSLVLLAALAGGAASFAADADPAASVLSPTKRQEVVESAQKMLAHHESSVIANDPFHPTGFEEFVASVGRPVGTPSSGGSTGGETTAAQPAGPRNERDLLQAIAAGIKSPNLMILGGQPVLLFGQKRVKAGGTVTITFEGSQYTLEITTIAPPNFTLRLNREEFTRTIK